MAKGLIVCFRKKRELDLSKVAEVFTERIRPDNAVVSQPYVHQEGELFTYIYNPSSTVRYHKNSFYLGVIEDPSRDVLEPRSPRPDGTFALFRADKEYVEILSDYAASRTIWYFSTDSMFIASTSQRLLLMFLGDFEPNKKTYNWLLSTGSLGPGLSWDCRLVPLTANSTVLLNRSTWDLVIEDHSQLSYNPINRSKGQHKVLLRKAIFGAIESLNLKPSEWTLALSGGMDSRSILYYLRNSKGLDTVTWGLKRSAERSGSDAQLAHKLAEMCGFRHEYKHTDLGIERFSTVLKRFLIAGEGRIDHLPGYMDGLKLWSDLSASDRGIIRGYDALGGSRPAVNEYQARRVSRLLVTTDYTGNVVPREFRLTEGDIPDSFSRRCGETLAQWRDRLWLQFRTPFMTAALDDIKVAYVEIVNPLLCRRVVQVIESLPDYLRTNKLLFRELVCDMFPDVPFATQDSIQGIDEIIGSEDAKTHIRDILSSGKEASIFPDEFLCYLRSELERTPSVLENIAQPKRTPFSRRIMSHLPDSMQSVVWWFVVRRQPMSTRRLALRAAIVIQMKRMLTEDAHIGRKTLSGDV